MLDVEMKLDKYTTGYEAPHVMLWRNGLYLLPQGGPDCFPFSAGWRMHCTTSQLVLRISRLDVFRSSRPLRQPIASFPACRLSSRSPSLYNCPLLTSEYNRIERRKHTCPRPQTLRHHAFTTDFESCHSFSQRDLEKSFSNEAVNVCSTSLPQWSLFMI